MARINGINSDYAMIGGTIQPVFPPLAPPALPVGAPNLELKLFLCPYNQPNGLEAESGTCNGINSTCPSPVKTGHALVHLSQTEGIKLVAGENNSLQLNQAGVISLSPTTKVQLNGPLEIVAAGQTFTVTPSAAGITLLHANGAQVVFKANGDFDLVTKNNAGTVNIQGNLVVSGTLTRQGTVL